jgi:hypothetical protein
MSGARVLPYQFQTQATPNWCGPSATRIALTALAAAALLPGQVPDQRELAIRLGAAAPDGTDTGEGTDEIDLIVGALNAFLRAPRYRVQRVAAPVDGAAGHRIRADLVRNIDAGYPLIANVVSGWRPSGYPRDRTVRHYVAVVGYTGGGRAAVIADPAFGLDGDGWGLPAATYEVTTDGLAAWTASKGYAA